MARTQSLAEMALAVRQRIDLNGQQNAFGSNSTGYVTDQEVTQYLNASVAEVFGILVSNFGDNYYFAPDYFVPIANGVSTYPLPQDCHKLLNVDICLGPNGTQPYRSIRPFNNHQRNWASYNYNQLNIATGWYSIKYQLQGQNIVFLPTINNLPPIRLQYIPEPPLLVQTLPTLYVANTVYTENQYVYVPITIPSGLVTNQVFMALNPGTSSGIGVGTIGTSNAAVTYTALQANVSVTINQTSGGVASVAVVISGTNVTINVITGTDTADQVATLVNGFPTAASYVTATGAGAVPAVSGTSALTNWSTPGTTQDGTVLWTYKCDLTLCQTYFDGIAGWEDLAILDTAVKCQIKQDVDVQALMMQKQAMIQRVQVEASNRNAGDVMVISGGYSMDDGGDDGNGWGGYI